MIDSRKAFDSLSQQSIKIDTYFPIYDRELSPYENKPIKLVEIGVRQGGSLLMWRKLFPRAEIIGIDIDEAARKMEGTSGIHIFVGDQTDPEFWQRFYGAVGKIDILIDDGGHTNKAQIVTVKESLPWINDGGVILIEDCNTSFEPRNGNPHRYSFLNYAHRIADFLNTRSLDGPENAISGIVHSMAFYDSVVCFHIDRRACLKSNVIKTGTEGIGADPYFQEDKRLIKSRSIRSLGKRYPRAARIYSAINFRVIRWRSLRENRALGKYF